VFNVRVDSNFDFLSAEYAGLFACSQATAFQHPLWLNGLYRQLLPGLRADPLVITVRAGDGRLALVLPLIRRHYGALKVVEFADFGVSDYACPVGSETDFSAILDDKFASNDIQKALKPFDNLRIQKLQSGSPVIEKLVGAREREPMNMSAHAVPLDPDYEVWRTAKVSASYRKELDKKYRQLHRKGRVAFTCATDPDVIRSTFHKMREYRQPRFENRGDGDMLQKQAYFDFYLDIAMRGCGTLSRLYSLTLDDCPIAGVMALSHQGKLLVILGGFDQISFKNQSIGSLTFMEVARHSIESGDSLLDFTIGDEPYKGLFGAVASPLSQISRAGSSLGTIAGLIVEQVPWARMIARRLMPAQRAAAVMTGPSPHPGPSS
jgi:CelD/BcsL family acetyltransferase involved in cellulose biosynthesis